VITNQTPILIINDPPSFPNAFRNVYVIGYSCPFPSQLAAEGGALVRTMQVKRLYSDYSLIIPPPSPPHHHLHTAMTLTVLVHRLLIAIPDHSHSYPSEVA
jgi:hypothetical protein